MTIDDHIHDSVMDEFERLIEAPGKASDAVYATLTVLNRCYKNRRALLPLANVGSALTSPHPRPGATRAQAPGPGIVHFRVFTYDPYELIIAHYNGPEDDFLAIYFGAMNTHAERERLLDTELKELWSTP